MAIADFTKDMNIIADLADLPNATDGLSAAELKAKFDEGGKALKDYINATIVAGINAHLNEKATDDVHGLLTDGKIISEVGSNANGKYVRFADGTQICFYTGYVTTGVSVAANASLNFRLTYPAAFVSGSNVVANVIVAYAFSGGGLETEIRPLGNVSSGAYHEDSGTTTTKRKLYYNRGSSTADRYAVEMYAIGRWK